AQPCRQMAHALLIAVSPLEDKKALYLGLFEEDLAEPARAGLGLLLVIVCDLAANSDPGARIDQRHHSVGNRAAHVVEVDVHAGRANLFEPALVIAGGPIVHAAIEAEFVSYVIHLLAATGDTDHAAPLDLGNLADKRADGAGRTRDYNCLSG